jgi:hypothetical protein
MQSTCLLAPRRRQTRKARWASATCWKCGTHIADVVLFLTVCAGEPVEYRCLVALQVGVLTMAGKTPRVLVTPTPDLGKVVLSAVRCGHALLLSGQR